MLYDIQLEIVTEHRNKIDKKKYTPEIVQRVQDIPQEELEVPMVADKVTKMDAKMVIKSIFR